LGRFLEKGLFGCTFLFQGVGFILEDELLADSTGVLAVVGEFNLGIVADDLFGFD
jgi:hypothetical protein